MVSQETFKTSVNIEFDIGEQSFLNSYMPTPSHADSIIGVSKGFLKRNTNSSHIMIGPYGSGKSLLATIIANIVGKKVSQYNIDILLNKFNKVHQDVYEGLASINKLDKVYLPVTLNGSYKDFGETLIETIQKELLENNISVFLPTEKNNILATIEDWKTNYSSTYNSFLEAVEKHHNNYAQWLSLIEKGDRHQIEWFKKIYTSLTSGAIFDSTKSGDFQENLKIVLDILKKENLGLFIIHDEFGRMLQTLDQHVVYKTMQELQDIAEFINRSDGYLQLLLISHKNMSQYMQGFNEEHKLEFQRIEKRYASYVVESDSATYYRIVEQYMENSYLLSNKNLQINEGFLTTLKGFNLFPELNQHEVENLIVDGCKPIHPITLFLLPRISKVFGQNERTLFTYLESDEPNGFKKSLEKANSFIYADSIFPYFFSDNNLNNIFDEHTESILKTYQLIRSNLDARKLNAYRIIQFITLWEVTNSNQFHPLNIDLISFATGIEEKRLWELLEELSLLKYVRFNRVHNKWELAEGSSVVVEELIEDRKANKVIDLETRVNKFEEIFPNQYYLARDYNDVKNITRFMKVKFINSTKFISKSFILNNTIEKNVDGIILYIILDNIVDYTQVINKIKENKINQIVFTVLKNELKNIKETIDNYIVIKELKGDTALLREYKNLGNELEIYEENYKYDIEGYLSSFRHFTSNVEWFYNGSSIFLNNELELEELISKIMWDLYPSTPVVMNDSINRFRVIGIQKRSILEVINRVLFSYYKDNIGIKGQGPDYLIYATIIKNNNIDLLRLNKIQNDFIKKLREDLLNHINKFNKGSLKNLYNIAKNSPYGIRPPLIPLFIVICLRDKWDQLMFYNNNMFVPALEGEKIQNMFKFAEEYEYVYQDYSEEVQSLLNQLENEFKSYISEYVEDETQLIRVSSGLLNWLRSLPKQTQITNKLLSKDALIFKDIIRRSEVNPISSIEELNRIYQGNIQSLLPVIDELKSAYNKFREAVETLLCNYLGIESFEAKNKFVNEWKKELDINNRLLLTLENSQTLDDFTYKFIGTEIKDFTDINFDLFETQIKNELNKLESGNMVDENSFQLTFNNKHKNIKKVELSKKSTIIYNNLERILKNAGRNVPSEEINNIILKLMDEYIE